MRLLSPKEAKEAVQGEEQRMVRERADYETETAKLRVGFFKLKEETEAMIESVRSMADEEKRLIQDNINVIRNELVDLENRKKVALEPIDNQKKEAEELFLKAQNESKQLFVLVNEAQNELIKAQNEKEQAEKTNDAANKALKEAADFRIKATAVLVEATKQGKEIEENAKKILLEVSDKEKKINKKEFELLALQFEAEKAKEEYISKITDLEIREKRLESKQQALKSAIDYAKRTWPMSTKIMDM